MPVFHNTAYFDSFVRGIGADSDDFVCTSSSRSETLVSDDVVPTICFPSCSFPFLGLIPIALSNDVKHPEELQSDDMRVASILRSQQGKKPRERSAGDCRRLYSSYTMPALPCYVTAGGRLKVN